MIADLPARVRALSGPAASGLAAACGAIMALAQPPWSLALFVFVALPPLLWLMDGAQGPRAAFWRGWAAGAGFFGLGLFWIVEPFLVDPERHGWMAPFALLLMAGGLALFWGAAFGLARLVWRPVWSRCLLLAAVLTLADFARAHVLTGFPWALIGYGWIETPVMQSVSVIGPHGLSLLTLAAGLAPAAAPTRRAAGLALALSAALVSGGWLFGATRLADPVPDRAEPLVVRLVQPNVPQHLKWRPELQPEFLERQLSATAAPADPSPDVTIWSETAVNSLLGYAPDELAAIAAAAGPEGVVMLGIRRVEFGADGDDRWFNSLVVLAPDGAPTAVYDKHRLVPFGEYIPFADAIAALRLPRLDTMTLTGFSPGPGPRAIGTQGLPPFLPLICYEAIFPQDMQPRGGRPDWIVQVTNDAWFGRIAGPYQHLAQARSRAIEQGLPLARAANTGVSAMIDPRGRVIAALPLGVQGYVDAALPASLPNTLYSRLGDYSILFTIFTVLVLTVRKI